MDGHKIAIGLFLVVIASGCAQMTGNATQEPGLESLLLSAEDVENETGANYTLANNSTNEGALNVSEMTRKVSNFFRKDENLSSAPETVQSMVVALNSSDEEPGTLDNFTNTSIEGYEARKLQSSNKTVLYGNEGNLSYFVKAEGDDGIFDSAKGLYIELSERVREFNQS